jgi:hypothetical protein
LGGRKAKNEKSRSKNQESKKDLTVRRQEDMSDEPIVIGLRLAIGFIIFRAIDFS